MLAEMHLFGLIYKVFNVYYVFNKCIKQSMIYLAGLCSYIRGCGIGSKNVQECSFMHKVDQRFYR